MESFSHRIDEDDDAEIVTDNKTTIVGPLVESMSADLTPHDSMEKDVETGSSGVLVNGDTGKTLMGRNDASSSSVTLQGPERSARRQFYEPPEFTQRLNVFEEVELGAQITFECQCEAFPRAVSRWFLDDVEITSTDPTSRVTVDHSAEVTDGILRLIIRDARKTDEGAYKCKSENQEGVASTTGYLSITGASIASSTNTSSSSSPRSEHAVSSPPLLRAITEQTSMEEREAAAAYEETPDEVSPFQQFIESVERGAATCWPYAELDFLRADQPLLLAEVAGAENSCGSVAEDVPTSSSAAERTATASGNFDNNETAAALLDTYDLLHSRENWGSDGSLEHISSEYPSSSSTDYYLHPWEGGLEVSRTPRPLSNSTEHTPTPESSPPEQLASSSPSFPINNVSSTPQSAGQLPVRLDMPERHIEASRIFANNSSADTSLSNSRPTSGVNRPRGQYATSVNDMDMSNFFVDIARSTVVDSSGFAPVEELLIGGDSSCEKKTSLERSHAEPQLSPHIPATQSSEVKEPRDLFQPTGNSPIKLLPEANNKVLNLFFASTKKKNDNVSKVKEVAGQTGRVQTAVDSSVEDAKNSTSVKLNNSTESFIMLPGIVSSFSVDREKVKDEKHMNANTKIISSYTEQIITPIQSEQSEHPGSPNTLTSSANTVTESNTTTDERSKTKTRPEKASKHFKLPKFFEPSTKVAISKEDPRQTTSEVYSEVNSLHLLSERNLKPTFRANHNPRKVQELDVWDALDWCIQWSSYPWNCYVGFAFVTAIYATFLQLNPAALILIVALLSAATFEVLLPKSNPTYQETDI